jgi:hypothetical protein
VSWATHNLLLTDGGCNTARVVGIQEAMGAAADDVLRACGYAAEPSGAGGAWLVTGHRHQETGGGR